MAISVIDDIGYGLANNKQSQRFSKTFAAPKAAGAYVSGWMAAGNPGAGSASPAYTAGSGYTCSSATPGAMAYVNGSVQNWLAKFAMGCTQPGVIILADRLWACSGMGFALNTYTVTTPGSLPARITDSGVGCEIYCEIYGSAAGSASGTLTVSYKDSAAATKSGVISAVVSAPAANQLQLVPHAAGTNSVSQIISAANSATWTSGSYGITILKRIIEIPIPIAGGGANLDWALLGLPKIPADACLQLLFLATNTTAPVIIGSYDLIDK